MQPAKQAIETKWAGTVPELKPGRYADGLPFHDIKNLSFKLILKPNKFTSRQKLFDFAKVLRRPGKEHGVSFQGDGFLEAPIKLREVLFVDTPDFRLYNNAFILRRRVQYQDGFPLNDPEIVFKFRHTDLQKAAETDVRPEIRGEHQVKFKCQVLPLKDQLGGIRLLYSHNVQFPRSSVQQNLGDVFAFENIVKVFPALEHLRSAPGERVDLVNEAIIEEVLQDIGMLDFGDGLRAKTNVGIWRTRGEHRPLIGEFAFQFTFKDRKELKPETMKRAERFFLSLQYAAVDWLALNATKTGIVYRLLGNPPSAHE